MITGINLNETIDYVSKKDTADNPTIWKLGIIPTKILGKASMQKDQMDMAFSLMQLGIKGWTNFNGIEYKTIKENKFGDEIDVVPLELINRIPFAIIAELSEEICKLNKLTLPETKN